MLGGDGRAQQAVLSLCLPWRAQERAHRHVRGVLSMGRYDDPNRRAAHCMSQGPLAPWSELRRGPEPQPLCSATSSFSILLGDAPHLDGVYCAFGKASEPPAETSLEFLTRPALRRGRRPGRRGGLAAGVPTAYLRRRGQVTAGWDTLTKFEGVETRREGIFVMPKERITILSTYVKGGPGDADAVAVAGAAGGGSTALKACERRGDALTVELHSIRTKKLPSM